MTRLRLLVACLVAVPVLAGAPAVVHELRASSADAPSVVLSPALSAAGSGRFSVLQMNLCLSGLASCLRYPQAVDEAVTVINRRSPNAVTLNEVCRRDVARIAARTGYHQRFTTVPYRHRPLPCSSPAGRGAFGNGVLIKGTIAHAVEGGYAAQDTLEQRRWLCATTARRVTVCTTHLEAPTSLATFVVRFRQCAELADVLAARARRGPTIAAGDMNGLRSCAPPSMWTRSDSTATQRPGLQHAYGSTADLLAPAAQVLPATSTDHDFLLVTARLVLAPRR